MNDQELIVSIRRLLPSDKRENGVGELVPNNQEIVQFLRCIFQDESFALACGVTVLCDTETEIRMGHSVPIRLFAPTLIKVFKNACACTADEANLFSPASFYYLEEEDWASSEPAPPIEIATVGLVQNFVAILKNTALFVNKGDRSLVFPDTKGTVDVPILVQAMPTDDQWKKSIESLIEFMSDELHLEHKKAALVDSVVYLVRTKDRSERFRFLLQNAATLGDRCVSEYSVFLSAFSFEKVKGEAEAIRVEFTARIHNVLSQIQGQLLGVPAAAIVVATQLKSTSELGSAFLANIGVLTASMLFAWLVSVLVQNQKKTLEVILKETTRRHDQLLAELSGSAADLEEIFTELTSRIEHQRKSLWLVDRTVLLGAAITFVAFCIVTKGALLHVACATVDIARNVF